MCLARHKPGRDVDEKETGQVVSSRQCHNQVVVSGKRRSRGLSIADLDVVMQAKNISTSLGRLTRSNTHDSPKPPNTLSRRRRNNSDRRHDAKAHSVSSEQTNLLQHSLEPIVKRLRNSSSLSGSKEDTKTTVSGQIRSSSASQPDRIDDSLSTVLGKVNTASQLVINETESAIESSKVKSRTNPREKCDDAGKAKRRSASHSDVTEDDGIASVETSSRRRRRATGHVDPVLETDTSSSKEETHQLSGTRHKEKQVAEKEAASAVTANTELGHSPNRDCQKVAYSLIIPSNAEGVGRLRRQSSTFVETLSEEHTAVEMTDNDSKEGLRKIIRETTTIGKNVSNKEQAASNAQNKSTTSTDDQPPLPTDVFEDCTSVNTGE